MSPLPNIPRRPVVLVIMDGFGTNPSPIHNAVAIAKTPNLDQYFSNHSLTLLQASGAAVGLPDGQMGNSEVGHLAIGCGEILRQDLVMIGDAINDGSFFENPVLLDVVNGASLADKPVHLIGLVSDGGVHSHIGHLMAVIELCRRNGARPMVHMITDGRDTAPKSALTFVTELESALHDAGGCIASVAGRYYAMDRDNRWERTEAAWQALVNLQGRRAESAEQVIHTAYEKGHCDEFIPASVLPGAESINDAGGVLFFNFRKDRARQLTSALYRENFDKFDRGNYRPIRLSCMTEYDEWYGLPYAFEQDRPATTLAEVVSQHKLQQFHCAETEKYAHVTYFFNGRVGDPHAGEKRQMVPSPREVETYDESPEMSASGIAEEVIEAIDTRRYALVVVNFANGDMVGHTGDQAAAVEALEAMDIAVGQVLDVAVAAGYSVVLTADHGNCELMVDPVTKAPHTQHTLFPVPCSIIDKTHWQLSVGAGLTSIAPTVLQLLGLDKPESMTGHSLLLRPIL